MPDDKLDREKLKELCAKATPGRLRLDTVIQVSRDGGKHGYREVSSDKSACWIARVQAFHDGLIDKASPQWEANAELYVAAVNALPALLEANERLEAELAEARRMIDEEQAISVRIMKQRDQAREQLTRAYSWIPENGMGLCPLCNSPDSDEIPRCKMCQYRKQAREQRDTLAGLLTRWLERPLSRELHAETQSALSAIKAVQENSKL